MSVAPVLEFEPQLEPPETRPSTFPYRVAVGVLAGFVLAVTMLVVLGQEQLSPVTILLSLVGLAALAWSSAGLSRVVTASAVLNVALIFLYTWSLGETIHVSIESTGATYVANVGGNRLPLKLVPPNVPRGWKRDGTHHRVGLYSSTANDYKATALGAALTPPATDPLTWLAQTFRFAVPGPGWINLHISRAGSTRLNLDRPDLSSDGSGVWSSNPRGEVAGTLGASGYFPSPVVGRYDMSGNLVRADGVQGLLVGINRHGRGFLFTVSMDRRYLRWYIWHGVRGRMLTETPVLNLGITPMIQRALRFTLPSVILALLLLTAALALYMASLVAAPFLERILAAFTTRLSRFPQAVRRGPDALAVALSVVSLVASSWVALVLYQGVPNVVDGITDLFQARTLALGRLSAPAPSLPSFFSEQYVLVHQGQWIGKYPPGWPLVLAVGVLFNTPWIVDPVMGAIGLFLVYLIGREVYGKKVALVASLLALTSPFLLFINGSFFPHATTWVFLGGFVYFVLRCIRSRSGTNPIEGQPWSREALLLVPAGLLLGLAFATRQLDAVAFSIPFVLVLLRHPLRVVWVSAGAALPGLVWLAYNDAVTGSLLGNAYSFFSTRDRLGFGNVGGAPGSYASSFTAARTIWNVAIEMEHLQSSLFGWPYFFALSLVVLPFVLWRANRWDFLLLASVLSVIAGYMFYWADGVAWDNFPRYWYVAVPILALLSARGVQELYRFPMGLTSRLPIRPAAAMVAPCLLIGCLVSFNLKVFLPDTAGLMGRWNSRNLIALDVVQQARVQHAIVFQVQGRSYWWPYGGVFPQNSPLLNGDVIWARDQGKRDKKLMRLYPGRAYYRLDNQVLTKLHL